jgi:hypothetical protein
MYYTVTNEGEQKAAVFRKKKIFLKFEHIVIVHSMKTKTGYDQR